MISSEEFYNLLVEDMGSFSFNVPEEQNLTVRGFPVKIWQPVPGEVSSGVSVKIFVDGECPVLRVWLDIHRCSNPKCHGIDQKTQWAVPPSEIASMKLRLAL